MQLVTYLCLAFQTISITQWVSSYCDGVLRPFKSNLQKKKKKKKETNVAMVDNIPFSPPLPSLNPAICMERKIRIDGMLTNYFAWTLPRRTGVVRAYFTTSFFFFLTPFLLSATSLTSCDNFITGNTVRLSQISLLWMHCSTLVNW